MHNPNDTQDPIIRTLQERIATLERRQQRLIDALEAAEIVNQDCQLSTESENQS